MHAHHPETDRPRRSSRRDLLKGGAALVAAGPAAALLHADPAIAQDSTGSVPSFAPLPAAALGPAIPSSGVYVEQIGAGLYYATEGFYQVMFLVHERGVVLVDAPATMGPLLLPAIRQVTDRPLTHFVYSHSHGDHTGAADLVIDAARREDRRTRVEVVAHRETARLLARRWPSATEVGGPRPTPTSTFSRTKVLRLGRQQLRLEYRGPNHSPDNLFIYAPRQRVLMLVDVLFPGWVPFKDLAFSQDIPGWFSAHDQALDYPFQRIVAGHVGRIGTRGDLTTQRRYIHELRDETRRAIREVDFREVARRLGTDNAWAIFDAYYDEVARVAADRVTPRWLNRLGAADVFTADHTLTLTASLRID